MTEQSIELDCPPGSPRPGDLILNVLKGTGLESKIPEPSMCFGNWKWNFSEVPEEKWVEVKKVIKPRITKLYNSGVIRYGSW